MKKIIERIIRPLTSRKVRVALATIVAAYLADAGIDASETVIAAVIATGVSVIVGIAIEDNGIKRRSSVLDPGRDAPVNRTAGAVARNGNGSSEAERN